MVGWAGVTFLSVASQAAGALLGGSVASRVHPVLVPTRYGRVMTDTSLSSAGSITQVGRASAFAAPAASRAARRPSCPRLAARSLLVRTALHTWRCGRAHRRH